MTRSLVLYYATCVLMFAAIVPLQAKKGACRMISELETCSWIDYNSWFPGVNAKNADAAIRDAVRSIEDEECAWAYQAYFCASTFPKCNENQDGPLPVCRDTCYELLDKCEAQYHKGVTSQLCDALPETECTSDGSVLKPSLLSLLPYIILVHWWTGR